MLKRDRLQLKVSLLLIGCRKARGSELSKTRAQEALAQNVGVFERVNVWLSTDGAKGKYPKNVSFNLKLINNSWSGCVGHF
jgi:hypothetical protein